MIPLRANEPPPTQAAFSFGATARCIIGRVEPLTATTFTADQRRRFADDGISLGDGSFPIRNRSDLRHALRALGRAKDVDAARTHIEKRARDLGLTALLPDTWGITASGEIVNQDWHLWPQTGNGSSVSWTPTPAEPIYPQWSDAPQEEIVAAMLDTIPIGLAPIVPPAEWFNDPQLDAPTPLTVTADGRVYGHLAEFGKCHRGIGGRCVFAPRTKNQYASFYAGGRIMLDNGEQMPVGRLTVGLPHASLSDGAVMAAAHYDRSDAVAAFVRAGEDRFGPWLAGATRSNATPEQIRDLRANPPSGDWRNTEGKGLELVAALAVPVPGFPVMAVAASAHPGYPETVEALILTFGSDEPLAVCASAMAENPDVRKRVLAARIRGGITGLAELFG